MEIIAQKQFADFCFLAYSLASKDGERTPSQKILREPALL